MSGKPVKAVALWMVCTMLLTLAACSKASGHELSDIQLTKTERAWSNPEEDYSGLLASYGGTHCAGAQVIATDKDIVYLYCEDAAEKDGATLVSQDTVFDIASVSKVFTAVCILQLAEKGRIRVDDTLDKYFPAYEAGKGITLYNLLHMNSGIPDYMNNPDPFWGISGEDAANKKISEILQDKTSDKELLEALYQAPLEFGPGTETGYSNTNYRLLAFIIEQVSGMKYCDYVRKNIFEKCGMNKTTSMAVGDMTYVPANFSELAEYEFTDPDGYPVCPNNSRGDGGIHSCLTDMVTFDRALFGGKLLSEKSMEILLHDEGGYCCGLRKEKNGYSHEGSSLTCSANNSIIESEEFGHIYLITLEHASPAPQLADAAGSGVDPGVGTNYTKGVFKDGVYVNEYAGVRARIPEEYEQIPDVLISDTSAIVNDCETDKDRRREAATIWDGSFYRAATDNIHFKYVNTVLAAPDDADYSENSYLDDFSAYMKYTDPDKWVSGGRTMVQLGGKDYVRQSYSGFDSFTHKDEANFIYARKLDDNLMSVVWVIVFGDEDASPKDYEALFE